MEHSITSFAFSEYDFSPCNLVINFFITGNNYQYLRVCQKNKQLRKCTSYNGLLTTKNLLSRLNVTWIKKNLPHINSKDLRKPY